MTARLLALACWASLLPSCATVENGGGETFPPPQGTPAELRAQLESLANKEGFATALRRARIYSKLRSLEEPDAPDLISRGDEADIGVLSSKEAPAEVRTESAARVSLHFRERAAAPGLRRWVFGGPVGELLQKVVLLKIAAGFAEYVSEAEHRAALALLAEAAEALAKAEALNPASARDWHLRAAVFTVKSADRPAGPPVAARKFCEAKISDHLDEGTDAANRGTEIKVSRGEEAKVVDCYIDALAHFELVRESLVDPAPGHKIALAAMDVVLRKLNEMICREP